MVLRLSLYVYTPAVPSYRSLFLVVLLGHAVKWGGGLAVYHYCCAIADAVRTCLLLRPFVSVDWLLGLYSGSWREGLQGTDLPL